MNNYIDLHIHTRASDGTYSLADVLEGYYQKGFKAIAITDHDTVDAFQDFTPDFYKEMRVIKGTEVSCRFAGREVHILGYDIDYSNKILVTLLNQIKNSRIIRAEKIITLLQENKIDIEYSDVQELVGNENIVGRPHIAQALMNKGLITHQQQAFDRYIGDQGFAYVPKLDVSPQKVIDAIHSAGGFAILAHPYKSINLEDIHYFKKAGIDGIETYYYDHSPSQVNKLEAICRDMNLICTGGSDFHGYGRREDLGSYQGNLKIFDNINKFLKLKIEVDND
ncbi:PHP domain-containing protein [bacterium]|nr:PHP domain-containing protein [bacterium]